jgi:hypothetical protein
MPAILARCRRGNGRSKNRSLAALVAARALKTAKPLRRSRGFQEIPVASLSPPKAGHGMLSTLACGQEGNLLQGKKCPHWSKADMCGARGYVRFTPDSDRESGFSQRAMSALLPIADMCSSLAHVCFRPKADMRRWRLCVPNLGR